MGTGFDAHAFEDGVPLVLGGVRIEHPRGMSGHSDGDVLAHALTDAVLGAAGMEDIGALFPSGDPALEGADSLELLREALGGTSLVPIAPPHLVQFDLGGVAVQVGYTTVAELEEQLD